MSDWQPIETVPENEPVFIALNDKDTGLYWGCWPMTVSTNSAVFRDGKWIDLVLQDGMSEVDWDAHYVATHWMPLPEAPKL